MKLRKKMTLLSLFGLTIVVAVLLVSGAAPRYYYLWVMNRGTGEGSWEAAVALESLSPKDAEDWYSDRLGDDRWDTRLRTIRRLVEMKSMDSIPLLLLHESSLAMGNPKELNIGLAISYVFPRTPPSAHADVSQLVTDRLRRLRPAQNQTDGMASVLQILLETANALREGPAEMREEVLRIAESTAADDDPANGEEIRRAARVYRFLLQPRLPRITT